MDRLQAAHPTKRFTLDGRLVGDLGEILVSAAYDVTLFDGLEKHHDAQCTDGRKVQIKATMQKCLTFPCDHVPDYYVGILIHRDGTFSELFNGPGAIIASNLARRKGTKTNLHAVTLSSLLKLNSTVEASQRIPLRRDAIVRPVPPPASQSSRQAK